MGILTNSRWLLFFLLIVTCILLRSEGRGGRGGGGRSSSSRSSSSRSSSSRSSSSSSRSSSSGSSYRPSSSSSGSSYRPSSSSGYPSSSSSSSSRGTHSSSGGSSGGGRRTETRYVYEPYPAPAPKPQPKPSAPEVVRQPAVNPYFKESNPNQGYHPSSSSSSSSSSRGTHSSSGGSSGGGRRTGTHYAYEPYPAPAPKPSAPEVVRQPAVNPYFKESNPNQGNRQPAYNPNYKDSNPGANLQPPPYSPRVKPPPYTPNQGIAPPPYSSHGSPYVGPQYPRQVPPPYSATVGIPGANYPRQTYNYPPNTLGSNVWQPQSGRPAPVYMNYGGLPTGSNIYSKPEKKKGFVGSLMSMGSHKPKKNKYYGSQFSPYGMKDMGGTWPSGGGFLGKHGSKASMYTILPYMAQRKSPKFFRPRFGYHPVFFHSPIHHRHYHYGHDSHTYFEIDNNEYVGRCNRPLSPDHGKVVCNSSRNEVACDVKCEDGYVFSDNVTIKSNKCWHVSGVWKPMKNFPACQPVCNRTCLNGGTCIGPNVCKCPPEYRGLQCEFYFLKCDIRKLANGIKIKWTCTHSKNDTTCKIRCQEPLQFSTPTEEVYRCSPNGVWTPSSIPECVSTESVTNAIDVSSLEKEKLDKKE